MAICWPNLLLYHRHKNDEIIPILKGIKIPRIVRQSTPATPVVPKLRSPRAVQISLPAASRGAQDLEHTFLGMPEIFVGPRTHEVPCQAVWGHWVRSFS